MMGGSEIHCAYASYRLSGSAGLKPSTTEMEVYEATDFDSAIFRTTGGHTSEAYNGKGSYGLELKSPAKFIGHMIFCTYTFSIEAGRCQYALSDMNQIVFPVTSTWNKYFSKPYNGYDITNAIGLNSKYYPTYQVYAQGNDGCFMIDWTPFGSFSGSFPKNIQLDADITMILI